SPPRAPPRRARVGLVRGARTRLPRGRTPDSSVPPDRQTAYRRVSVGPSADGRPGPRHLGWRKSTRRIGRVRNAPCALLAHHLPSRPSPVTASLTAKPSRNRVPDDSADLCRPAPPAGGRLEAPP